MALGYDGPGLCSASSAFDQLLHCYNRKHATGGQRTNGGSSFEGFLRGIPADLTLHLVLWSEHPPSPLPLTIVTVATLSRLPALETQCSSWAGTLAAAVYLPLTVEAAAAGAAGEGEARTEENEAAAGGGEGGRLVGIEGQKTLREAESAVRSLFDRSEARAASRHGCRLRLLLLYELLPPPDGGAEGGDLGGAGGAVPGGAALMYSLLPINSLRNAALLAADTPVVAMVDVDLMVARGLSTELEDLGRAAALTAATAAGQVFILPAFETSPQLGLDKGVALALKAAAGSKKALQALLEAKQVITFAALLYAKGHACTRFRTWFGSSAAFATNLTINCEPWFAIDRRLSPQYDVRFRGYGWNKVQQVAHVASMPFSLMVHPTAFLVHVPHPPSKAMDMYMASDKARAKERMQARQQQQQQQQQRQGQQRQGQQRQGQQRQGALGRSKGAGRGLRGGHRAQQHVHGGLGSGEQAGVRGWWEPAGGRERETGQGHMGEKGRGRRERGRRRRRLSGVGAEGRGPREPREWGRRLMGPPHSGRRVQAGQEAWRRKGELRELPLKEGEGQRRGRGGLAGESGEGRQRSGAGRQPSAAAQAFHLKVTALRAEVLADIAAKRFVPVVDERTRRCRDTLPWWKEDKA